MALKHFLLALLLCSLLTSVLSSGGGGATCNLKQKGDHEDAAHHSNKTGDHGNKKGGGIKVFKADFSHVKGPFIVAFFVLLVSMSKLGEWGLLYCLILIIFISFDLQDMKCKIATFRMNDVGVLFLVSSFFFDCSCYFVSSFLHLSQFESQIFALIYSTCIV